MTHPTSTATRRKVRAKVDYAEVTAWDASAEVECLRSALMHVRAIIKDGAMTGFNCLDGDWADRLFASQAVTHAALNFNSKREKQ